MTLLWIAGGLLAALSMLLLVQPLVRRRPAPPPREGYDAAVLVDQLAEIDRDAAAGLIDAEAAAGARRELKRRLLLAMEGAQAQPAGVPSVAGPRRLWLAAMLAVVLPVVAGVVYLGLGSPESPDQPLVVRQTSGDLADANRRPPVDPSLVDTVTQLERYLVAHPGEGQGWFLLGRSYLTLERATDAVTALAKAKSLLPDRPDVTAAYGEALVIAADGRVDQTAQAEFEQALAADPRNVQARYYLALGRAQQNDVGGALQAWVDLVALSPADAPWLPLVRQQIVAAAQATGVDPATLRPSAAALALAPPATEAPAVTEAPAAAPGPSAEDMKAAAQMSPEQRQSMIRSMVERLATRLQQNPDDRQGWLRLARAYDVLGETAKAAEARARAEAATK